MNPLVQNTVRMQHSRKALTSGPMKIKKFSAPSMSECLVQVKRELGEDAVILDSRKVRRGGPFSFLLEDMVEVTASTVDRSLARAKRGREGKAPFSGWSGVGPWSAGGTERPGRQDVRGSESGTPDGAYALLSDEIRGLKETVLQMADHIKYDRLPSLPRELERLHRNLLDNGVEPGIAATLTQEMTLRLSGEEFEDRQLLIRTLRERIGSVVKAAPVMIPIPILSGGKGKREDGKLGRPWVIALVGPTGVGKTTTLAKMATHPDIFGRKRVALVSADTYRMAAVEQLKTFASIAGVPMEAVYRPADIGRVIGRFRDRDIVLIDTAGRSQNNMDQLKDLAAFMEYAKADEVHLVLSVTTRLEDQLDVIAKFRAAGPSRLLFTKLDETTNFGMILNVCFHERKPVSLLTCGQNVPDDILAPNQTQLVRLASEKSFCREMMREVAAKLNYEL